MIENIKQEFFITNDHKIMVKYCKLMGSQTVFTSITEWVKDNEDQWLQIRYRGIK